jgi:hypothetical protein
LSTRGKDKYDDEIATANSSARPAGSGVEGGASKSQAAGYRRPVEAAAPPKEAPVEVGAIKCYETGRTAPLFPKSELRLSESTDRLF